MEQTQHHPLQRHEKQNPAPLLRTMDEEGVRALIEESMQPRQLVIHLSTLVIKHVVHERIQPAHCSGILARLSIFSDAHREVLYSSSSSPITLPVLGLTKWTPRQA